MGNKTVFIVLMSLLTFSCISIQCQAQAFFTSDFKYSDYKENFFGNDILAQQTMNWIYREKEHGGARAGAIYNNTQEEIILAEICDFSTSGDNLCVVKGDPCVYAYSIVTKEGSWSMMRHGTGHLHKFHDYTSHEFTLLIPMRMILFFHNEMIRAGISEQTVYQVIFLLTEQLMLGNMYGFNGGYCVIPDAYKQLYLDKTARYEPPLLFAEKCIELADKSLPDIITELYEFSFSLNYKREQIDRDILISILSITTERMHQIS